MVAAPEEAPPLGPLGASDRPRDLLLLATGAMASGPQMARVPVGKPTVVLPIGPPRCAARWATLSPADSAEGYRTTPTT
jgi:hypothetical protein